MNSGIEGRVKGIDGTAMFLVYRDQRSNYAVKHVWAGIVGQNGVKADTWYMLNEHGELVEV